jgi:hypothetical protein
VFLTVPGETIRDDRAVEQSPFAGVGQAMRIFPQEGAALQGSGKCTRIARPRVRCRGLLRVTTRQAPSKIKGKLDPKSATADSGFRLKAPGAMRIRLSKRLSIKGKPQTLRPKTLRVSAAGSDARKTPQFAGDHTARDHPFPSRTRKLSLAGPMVLHGRPCGRLGDRRQ